MNQQMVKINTEKFATAKTQFASNLDKLNSGVTKLTAMEGGVTPDQVSQVLVSEVLPALDGVKNVIAQIDEALPTTEGEEGIMGEGGDPSGLPGQGGEGGAMPKKEETEPGVLSAMDGEHEGDKDIHTAMGDNPKNTDAADAALQKRLQHVEAKLASMTSENVTMKKASLSKKYASQFPIHMRSAMEAEFLKENENEELEAMEAKLATASAVLNAYKTAGLIKKASFPAGGQIQTAKYDKTKGGQGPIVPWNMR